MSSSGADSVGDTGFKQKERTLRLAHLGSSQAVLSNSAPSCLPHLLRVLHPPRLADDMHFDLARVLHIAFDLLGDIARQLN